jgi:hypothetical protein
MCSMSFRTSPLDAIVGRDARKRCRRRDGGRGANADWHGTDAKKKSTRANSAHAVPRVFMLLGVCVCVCGMGV